MGDIQDLENESYNIEQVNTFIFVLQIALTYQLAYAKKISVRRENTIVYASGG